MIHHSQLPVGSSAKLADHCTDIANGTNSNPLQAWIFFFLHLLNLRSQLWGSMGLSAGTGKHCILFSWDYSLFGVLLCSVFVSFVLRHLCSGAGKHCILFPWDYSLFGVLLCSVFSFFCFTSFVLRYLQKDRIHRIFSLTHPRFTFMIFIHSIQYKRNIGLRK